MRTLLLALVGSVLVLPSTAAAAAPVNDNFVDAIDLSSLEEEGFFFQGTNVGATEETGEPDHAGNAGGKSVWFTWTAPGDGSVPHVAIRADGSFDTLLGVYTGAAVNALTEVASNDDSGFTGSSVSFATTAGTTYRIAVDGFAGKSGPLFVDASPSPANDNFADAIPLPGASGTRAGDTIDGATVELGELADDMTIWYSFQPPADGTYRFSTFGSRGFDSLLAVYEGTSIESLNLLDFNDDDPDRGCCSSWSPLVDAEASKTYMIQVWPLGLEGPGTDVTISWGPLILGTSGADMLVGTTASEEIRGQGGDDVVAAGVGEDLVFGGTGDDELSGQGGGDLVLDRRGLDLLVGGNGTDVLDARDGSPGDRLRGGNGNDLCRGNRGDIRRNCP